jgi:signal transduction histidine kinase
VRDEGSGFDTEMLKKPSGDSRGFGLFNLAESAARLHALVDVRSHEGQGTTVTVRVARIDPARESTAAPKGQQ